MASVVVQSVAESLMCFGGRARGGAADIGVIMAGRVRLGAMILLTLLMSGCATTYVPVSWGLGDKVAQLSRSDLMLATLYSHYDPERSTLRFTGASFDEVMMPSEVKFHLGAYRTDTKLIYRNLYHDYPTDELRDVLLHELAHHIWFNFMSSQQRSLWRVHLGHNPSPLQQMVRRNYPRSTDYNSEDFAFTVEFARPVDIRELATLGIISLAEEEAILQEFQGRPNPAASYSPALTAVLKQQAQNPQQLEGQEP
jgi:hypothetical protein